MSDTNKALVVRWFEEVWNKGNAGAIDEMMAPSCLVYGLGPTAQTPADFKQFHAAYRDAFPDVKIVVEHLIAEGDSVAARWTGTGTHLGHGLGFAATKRAAQFHGMVFVRIENGRMVEGWNSFDQLGMFQQLGLVTMPS